MGLRQRLWRCFHHCHWLQLRNAYFFFLFSFFFKIKAALYIGFLKGTSKNQTGMNGSPDFHTVTQVTVNWEWSLREPQFPFLTVVANGGVNRILRGWPASLVQLVSSRFRERPCVKKP